MEYLAKDLETTAEEFISRTRSGDWSSMEVRRLARRFECIERELGRSYMMAWYKRRRKRQPYW